MELEVKKYKVKELAEWFNISSKYFSTTKTKRLEELSHYADFEVKYTPTGRISYIEITDVKVPIYGALNLKQQFLNWLPGGLIEVATWAIDFEYVLSWPLLVNYYCREHEIKYNGPHYIMVEDEGISIDNKRKIKGQRKVPNPEYKEWHYLYNVAKKWGIANNISLEDVGIDCCVDSFNPTSMRITTDEDLEKREQVYKKWFGTIRHQEVLDFVDYIDEYEDCYIPKDELMQLKLCQRLSDKEKRLAAAKECAELGILRRKGYRLVGLKLEDLAEK